MKSKFYLDKRFGVWYNKLKLKRNRELEEMNMFDFKNKNYNIEDAVNDAKTKPEVALWFTNHMEDSDLAKIFVEEWCRAMDEKEGVADE